MTPNTSPHLLVIGAGSVGKRHLRNLSAMGCRVSAVDPREDRLGEAGQDVPLESTHAEVASALAIAGPFDGAVVASPPTFHVEQCLQCIAERLPILLEKPVSPDLAAARRLEQAVADQPTALLLGYTYRWWPPLQAFRARILAGDIGRPLHARFVMSAHLADWHSWERYQDFFMASKELGGGALLDESHFIDLMLWFFGMPESVFARVERLSTLEIDTDDHVDIVALYPGLRATLHLDLYGRPHEKYISVTGEGGTLVWSFEPNQIRFGSAAGQTWVDEDYTYERNDMFVAAAREFLNILQGGTMPSCTVKDGIEVMRVIEACRRSTNDARLVGMSEI